MTDDPVNAFVATALGSQAVPLLGAPESRREWRALTLLAEFAPGLAPYWHGRERVI
jgi:hypothetical protein